VPNTCPFCEDTASGGQVANKWQLEVEAPYGVTPPSPCGSLSAGTDDICNNAAGTWILSRGYGPTETFTDIYGNVLVSTKCVWESPSFEWYGVVPLPDQFNIVYCYACASMFAKYVLTLERLYNLTTNAIVSKSVYLTIDYSGYSFAYTRWFPSTGETVFDCLGVNQMDLDRDTFHIGGDAGPQSPFCCDGVPNSVYLLPYA
jgi:hypothetical protein